VLLFNLQRPDFAVDTHVFRLACAAGWVPSEAAVKSHNHNCGVGKGGKGAKGGKAGAGQPALGGAWPPPSRETAYLHLNAMVPDELKYSLHVNLIAHGRTLSPASGPKDAASCPIAQRGSALKKKART